MLLWAGWRRDRQRRGAALQRALCGRTLPPLQGKRHRHRADTTGYGDSAALDEILPNTDLVLLDLKHMDSAAHKKWTGVDNRLILENARRIARAVPVRISLPLIAGVNDGVENIRATAAFAAEIGAQAVDMNPLHTLGAGKYHYLGKRSPYGQFRRLEKSEVDEVAEIFRSFGLHCGVGRMM